MVQSPSKISVLSWKRQGSSRGRQQIRINRRYTESIDGIQENDRQASAGGEEIVDGRVASAEAGREEVALEEGRRGIRGWGGERRYRSTCRRDARHRRVAGEGENDRQVSRARISSPSHRRAHHGPAREKNGKRRRQRLRARPRSDPG